MSWGRQCSLSGPWEGSRDPGTVGQLVLCTLPGQEAEIEAAGAQGQEAIALALLWHSGAWAQGARRRGPSR